jgi:hypothetical protein
MKKRKTADVYYQTPLQWKDLLGVSVRQRENLQYVVKLNEVEQKGRYKFVRSIDYSWLPQTKQEADTLDEVYRLMQGEVWSPNGEARELIESLRLHHTSMSVGDVVKLADGTFWILNSIGWGRLS